MSKLGLVVCTAMALTFSTASFATGGMGPGSPPGTAKRLPGDPPTSPARPPAALGDPFAARSQASENNERGVPPQANGETARQYTPQYTQPYTNPNPPPPVPEGTNR